MTEAASLLFLTFGLISESSVFYIFAESFGVNNLFKGNFILTSFISFFSVINTTLLLNLFFGLKNTPMTSS